MDAMERLIKDHEYLTPRDAEKAGATRFHFYQSLREHGWEQVRRGVYAPKDAWVDELYLLHLRSPQLVFSHDEAFYHYGLSEREPLLHTVTLYSGYNAHRLVADGRCKVYTVKKELLPVGRTMVRDNCGNAIPMYDLERTICDLFRSRSTIEIQDFTAVLKAYAARRDKDLNRLTAYAKLFHLENVIRQTLQLLL